MWNIWLNWSKNDVRVEQRQLREEGRDTAALEALFDELLADATDEKAPAFQSKFNDLLDRAQELPQRPGYAWQEPDALDQIRAQRPAAVNLPAYDSATIAARMAGAWLGRCAGCWLGKPVEGWKTPRLHQLFAAGGASLPTQYLWTLPMSKEDDAKFQNWFGGKTLPEYRRGADGMPEDDDVNYTIAGLCLIEKHGTGFTPDDVANFWLQNIPLLHVCTAERVAYRNWIDCINPPLSARVRNPYREWIGAQIRADFFGYAAPGNPELAAEMAWRDASISHVKNGIYGEMWVAAMLAAAATTTDMRLIIEAGLAQIPQHSRLAESLRDVLKLHVDGKDYYAAIELVQSRWTEYDSHCWCHTISNAMIVAAALLWGGSDLDQVLGMSIWPGFDTDCNGATAGSVAGMAYGELAFAAKWREPLQDKVHSGIYDNTLVKLSDLVARSLRCLAK